MLRKAIHRSKLKTKYDCSISVPGSSRDPFFVFQAQDLLMQMADLQKKVERLDSMHKAHALNRPTFTDKTDEEEEAINILGEDQILLSHLAE